MGLEITPDRVETYVLYGPKPLLFDFLTAPEDGDVKPEWPTYMTALRRTDLADLRIICKFGRLAGVHKLAPPLLRLLHNQMIRRDDDGWMRPTDYGREVCRYNVSCRDSGGTVTPARRSEA